MRKGAAIAAAIALGFVAITFKKAGEDVKSNKGLFDKMREAGKRHAVDPLLLLAIAKVESNLNPAAIGPRNSNGTRDYGLMQINSVNFHDFHTTVMDALDVNLNIEIAATLLARKRKYLDSHGIHSESALIASYNQGEGRTVRNGILNAWYVAKVTYWLNLYRLNGVK